MQDFNELNPTTLIKNDRATINANFKTVASNFAGTAFPTNNLVEGMQCYRTDLNKLYRLQKDLTTWVLEVDFSTGVATTPKSESSNALTAAYVTDIKGGDGKITVTTKTNGVDASEEIETGKVKTVNNIEPDDKGNIAITTVENAENSTNATNAENSTNATNAVNDGRGANIAETYIKGVSATDNIITITNGNDNAYTVSISDPTKINYSSSDTFTATTQKKLTVIESSNKALASSSISAANSISKGNAIESAINPKPQASTGVAVSALNYLCANDKLLIEPGIGAGTYTLKTLLQKLIKLSHSHSASRTLLSVNCNCNCGDSDSDSG